MDADKRDRDELEHMGRVAICARRWHRSDECGLKNPLVCKIHGETELKKRAAATWRHAEERLH